MRLTDFLRGPASRQVQYFPDLVPILGSVTATILFGQLLYWSDKGSDPEGWVYKSQPEITKETALTREEQECARKKLRDVGILKEKKKGIPCRLWFLLDLNKVNELWEKSQQYPQCEGKPQTSMRDSRKQACGNAADKSGGKPQATTIDYPADDAVKNNSSRSASPAAASSATPTGTKTLTPDLEALIIALPTAHQDDARKAVLGEEGEEDVKASCLAIFARKLIAGKAENSAWLRTAIREDWGKAERSKAQKKKELKNQKEQERSRESEALRAQKEALSLRKLEIQKSWLELSEADQELIKRSILDGPFDLTGNENQLTWACLRYLAKQLGYPDDYLG